jgi:hypothetical protein
MQNPGKWYQDIHRELETRRQFMSAKLLKKYNVDLTDRIALRIDELSLLCPQCQAFRPEVAKIVHDLANYEILPKETIKRNSKSLNDVVKHLQKEHHLVKSGQYVGIWMSLGPALGLGIGLATGNSGIGTMLGVVIGLAIGFVLDKNAKIKGKVI